MVRRIPTDAERPSADDYLRVHNFCRNVKKSTALTWQQKKTICGQATHGDLAAAEKGYKKLTSVRD